MSNDVWASRLATLGSSITASSLPSLVVEVIEVSARPDVDIDELADLVRSDPALSARFLRLTNSPAYGRERDVTNVTQAIMVLGARRVGVAAVAFAMIPLIAGHLAGSRRRFQDYWRHTVTAATAARELALRVCPGLAEECHLGGLLMDIAVPIIGHHLGPEYEAARGEAFPGHPDIDREAEALGTGHPSIGAALLDSWRLPRLLVDAVAAHHGPPGPAGGHASPAGSVARCLAVAHALSATLASPEGRWTALGEARECCRRWFGLEYSDLEDILLTLVPGIEAALAAFEVDGGPPADIEAIVRDARSRLAALRPCP